MAIATFIRSLISGAGTGVADLAFEQQQNLTPASLYGARRNVQGALNPQAPAFVKMGQQIVPVSLLGDSGLSLQGQFDLTALAEEGK